MTEFLWVDESVIDRMVFLGQECSPFETGGVLIGYYSEKQWVVTDFIDPGPNSKNGKNFFSPDDDYQLVKLESVYDESNGVKTYIGDWHTHPESCAAMSSKDRRTLLRITRKTLNIDWFPVMMIISLANPISPEIRGYVSLSRKFHFLPNDRIFRELDIRIFRANSLAI